MKVIPSVDLLAGQVVRLKRGDFSTARVYGTVDEIISKLGLEQGARLHVVDLEASRSGHPIETDLVTSLVRRGLAVQVGGGIRSLDDARRWIDCGAARIVVGTAAAESPALLEALVATFGAQRIIAAVDVREGAVRVDGWERESRATMAEVFARVEALGLAEALVTDIGRDGVMLGPSLDLYRSLAEQTSVKIIASGGVAAVSDVVALARMQNVSGCVIGRALLEGDIVLADAMARVAARDATPERIIPCLDIRDGRVVKGVSFANLRDAGDPVECALRYEEDGADELVILDVSATDRERATSLDVVRRVADSIFIPLTVGGGVRAVEDFRTLLHAGADRVAINTAALRRPELISECAAEFGVQAVVLSCDAKREGDRWIAAVRSARDLTAVDAVAWCIEAEARGAGEILLTSVDRDGTNAGFDIELLRAVTRKLRIGVIASGGAGRLDDFRDAIELGGARAVLAASLFHDGVLTVSDVKRHLAGAGIPVRDVARAEPAIDTEGAST